MRGTIALAYTLRLVRNIGDSILSWSWILVWAEPISLCMTTGKDVVISGGFYNFIIRDVCWARTGPVLIFNIFNHSESRLQSEYAIVSLDLREIGVVVCGAQRVESDGVLVILVIDVTSLGHVLPLFTKSTLVLQLFLKENRESFVVVVDVRAWLVGLL